MAKDRDRQRDLLEAAAREFATRGYAGARVDAIAARAGVNKQLVFYYFGSKRGLFDAVVAGRPPDLPKAETSLRRAVEAVFDWLDHHPERRCTLFDPAAERAAAAALIEQLEAGVRQVIAEGQGLGYFRDSADPARIARQALVLAAGWFALHQEAGAWRDFSEDAADTLLRALAW